MSETITATPTSFRSILDTNKNELARIETYKGESISATPRNIAFGVLILGGLFAVSLFALQIITGVLALVTVGAVGIGGFLGLRWLKAMDPVIKQKTKNFQIKTMMNEARKNAVHQLENQVIVNGDRLVRARKARDKIGGQIEALKKKVNPANEGKPIYETKMNTIAKFEGAYEQIIVNLEKAAASNRQFKAKVQDYKDLDAFTQAAGDIEAGLGGMGGSELESMLTLEAFDHIDSEFSTALISIENSARDMTIDQED